MSGRAMVTASQSPRVIASSMICAVWKPPVQNTGRSPTAFLMARASGKVEAFDLVLRSARPLPGFLEQLAGQPAAEQQVVAQRQHAAGNQAVVGLLQLRDREIAGRVLGMRERGAGGDVNRVDAVLLEPLADLNRVLEDVAGLFLLEQRVVVLGRADLHLQVEVAADALADRLDDLAHEARPVGQDAAVFVGPVVDPRAQELA